jgi:hypothetical protein
VQIEVQGIVAFAEELDGKDYSHARPSLEHQPWGTTLDVTDPFGNQLRFIQSH